MLCVLIASKVQGTFFHGIQHYPPTETDSRTVFSGAYGGHPSEGAYSTAHYSQTVAVPSRGYPLVSTYYPSTYNSNHNQGYQQVHGDSRTFQSYNQVYHDNGYRTGQVNHPEVISYGLYRSNSGSHSSGTHSQRYTNHHVQSYHQHRPLYRNMALAIDQRHDYGDEYIASSSSGQGDSHGAHSQHSNVNTTH